MVDSVDVTLALTDVPLFVHLLVYDPFLTAFRALLGVLGTVVRIIGIIEVEAGAFMLVPQNGIDV